MLIKSHKSQRGNCMNVCLSVGMFKIFPMKIKRKTQDTSLLVFVGLSKVKHI